MLVIGTLIFSGAMALSIGVIVAMIAPQWRRIARLASGRPDEVFAPLATLAHAEDRIAVRRWSAGGSAGASAATPHPASLRRLRAAA